MDCKCLILVLLRTFLISWVVLPWTFSFVWAVMMYNAHSILLDDVLSMNYVPSCHFDHIVVPHHNEDILTFECIRVLLLEALLI